MDSIATRTPKFTTVVSSSKLHNSYGSIAVRSMEDLRLDGVATLATLAKVNGREEVISLLSEAIVGMLSFFSLKENMTPPQIEMTAELILDRYPNIGIDAVKLFFKRACAGDFGQTYGTMDGQKICIWFDKFYHEYWDAIYDKQENERKVDTDERNDEPIVIEDSEVVQRIINNLRGKGPVTDAELGKKMQIRDIRIDVQKKFMYLYDTMPVEEANAAIEKEIINEMRKQNLLTN